jgi:hypothetical protein
VMPGRRQGAPPRTGLGAIVQLHPRQAFPARDGVWPFSEGSHLQPPSHCYVDRCTRC